MLLASFIFDTALVNICHFCPLVQPWQTLEEPEVHYYPGNPTSFQKFPVHYISASPPLQDNNIHITTTTTHLLKWYPEILWCGITYGLCRHQVYISLLESVSQYPRTGSHVLASWLLGSSNDEFSSIFGIRSYTTTTNGTTCVQNSFFLFGDYKNIHHGGRHFPLFCFEWKWLLFDKVRGTVLVNCKSVEHGRNVFVHLEKELLSIFGWLITLPVDVHFTSAGVVDKSHQLVKRHVSLQRQYVK